MFHLRVAWRFEDVTVSGPPVPKPNLMFKMKIALSFVQIITQQAIAVDVQVCVCVCV
jgi:hypothetical protein